MPLIIIFLPLIGYNCVCVEYRNARAGAAGAGVYAFTESFAQSQQRQQDHHKAQQKEHEEYLKRVREFGKSAFDLVISNI